MLYYRFVINYQLALTWRVALLPFMLALMSLFTLGLGVLVSCLNVKYRDVGVALPVLIQLWMFVSPVIYPLSLVPQSWRGLYFLNPLTGIIEGFRSALFGGQLNRFGLAVAIIDTVILLVCSAVVFRRIERSFADVI